MRGPLAPPEVPVLRTRAERFDDLVADAVERLSRRWEEPLRSIRFLVEDVPPVEVLGGTEDDAPPLARSLPARDGVPARVVLHRRPLEARGGQGRALAALVHDVVVEQVAELLGVDPETLDPRYGD